MGKGSDTAKGAASGAAIGTAIMPGWGTAIGAGVGGIAGYFGSDDGAGSRLQVAEDMYGGVNRNNYNVNGYNPAFRQYSQMANQYGGRGAPQAGQSGFRNQQLGHGMQLQREANGNGIGSRLIRQQAQGQADRGLQQQMAMAASARPGQGASASRQAMMNAGNMNAQVGGQSAQAAGQYQLGAMQQYGQFLGQARGQDDSQSQFNADARLRQLGLNDQSQLDALRQRLQMQGMQQQGGMAYEQQRGNRYAIAAGQPTSNEQTMSALQGAANAYAMYNNGGNKSG